MLAKKIWQQKEKELAELQEMRKALSDKIHLLKCELRQHEKQQEKTKNKKTNTFAFKMFGKRLKDLTAEEFRIYYNTRQKINRENKKKHL